MSTSVPKETLISIRTEDGWLEINGEVLGDDLLAVHRSLRTADALPCHTPEAWTLTHIPSGHSVVKCASRADCLRVGRRLLEALGGASLAAWKRRGPTTVVRGTPKRIAAWIVACREARAYVEPTETS